MMSRDSCVQLLVRVVCEDGNLLLNVGPRADGSIEPEQVQRLREVGRFLSKYGESIYSTRGGIYDPLWGGTTVSDTAIYVHVLKVPPDRMVSLPPSSRMVVSARYLRDFKNATFVQSETMISITNIADKKDEPDLVLKLTLR